jgi:hypothetical protein
VGRFQRILGFLALSAAGRLAHAGEATATEGLAAPTAAPVPAPSATPGEAAAPEVSPPPARSTREARGARVLWTAPGEVPPPPRASLAPEQPAPRPRRFRISGVRWLVGLERASSIAAYHASARVDRSEVVTSGLEASIVGDLNQEAFTPLLLPRLSLDTRWANGFSLGLVLSYAGRSAERSTDEAPDTLRASESALLGPRVGWLKPLSSNVALWLRGGPTWALRASSEPTSEPGERRDAVEQQWALSLEPQLVVMPWRHIGLSLGAAFDVGIDGENEVRYRGGPQPESTRIHETVSTYGVTAGLLALF